MAKSVMTYVAAALLALASSPAWAGGCFSQVCAPRLVKVAPQVVYPAPQISYTYNFVGAPVREEAYAQQAVRQALEIIGETTERVTERRTEFRTAPQQAAQASAECSCSSCAVHGGETAAPEQFAREVSALDSQCARCHAGENAKAGLSLEGVLDAQTRLAAIRAVASKQMPPDRELSEDEASAVIQELLQLRE